MAEVVKEAPEHNWILVVAAEGVQHRLDLF